MSGGICGETVSVAWPENTLLLLPGNPGPGQTGMQVGGQGKLLGRGVVLAPWWEGSEWNLGGGLIKWRKVMCPQSSPPIFTEIHTNHRSSV